MAGDIPNLNVEILVQLTNLTAAVQEATNGLNKIGDGAKAQESKFSALKSTMLGVFAGNLMAQGAEMLATGLHDAVKAIEDTQVATEQLSTAMNNAKQNTAANREEVTKTSEKMGALGFSVADSEKALTKLVTATGSTEKATGMMAMAADLARYKHESLAEASATLVKGTLGNAKAFKEFGIVLDSHLPKNQAIAKAMDELNGKIGGQAVGYTHTFAGEMEILKAKFDDVAVKVGAVVMPILTKLMDIIVKVVIPYITKLYEVTIGTWIKQLINLWNTHEGLRKTIVEVLEIVIKAYGYLIGIIAKVVDTVAKIPVLGAPFKALGKGIDEAALSVGKFAGSLDGLANKKITLPTLGDALKTSGGTSAGGDTGVTGGLGAAGDVNKVATAAQKALDARNAKIKTLNDEALKLEDDMNTVLLDRQSKMADAQKTLGEKKLAAQVKYDDTVASIQQTFTDKTQAAQDAFNSSVEQAQTSHAQNKLAIEQQYADKALQIEKTATDKKASIVMQSIDLMTNAFESATKVDLGKLFTAGGATAAGLQDQLKAQLAAVLQLQKDAGLLAAQGYNQSFIDEVISQGPQQGDALAQAVLTATPDTQASIRDLYKQINSTSQEGVTQLATQMNDGVNFANQKLAQQFKQVGVDLQLNLTDNSAQLASALNKNNDTFNAAMIKAQDTLDKATAAATDARDLALNKAQETLTASLTTAQDAFDKSVKAISDSTMKQLDALMAKLTDTAAKITALGGSTASISAYSPSIGVASGTTTTTPSYTSSPSFGLGQTSPTPSISITNNNTGVSTSPAEIATATLNAVLLGQTQGINTSVGLANKLKVMGVE
jgi:hypothetical protein